MDSITVSGLGHTWLIDLDGTVLRHNGHKTEEGDSFLPGAKEFLQAIPDKDMVVIITSREECYRELTESFLKANDIRYDAILFQAPCGERILLNDRKPSGLDTAVALNLERDGGLHLNVKEDTSL